MLVLAISVKGREYMYNARSARLVSARSAEIIKKIVNDHGFLLKNDNETWFLHDVGPYDAAYHFAQLQKFTIRNGIVTARNY